MVSLSTNEVISSFGSSCSSRYSGCLPAFSLPVSVTWYRCKGRLATVSAITRTQAYTVDTWMAVLALTGFPAALEPKKNAGAALTAFWGLSRERNMLNILIAPPPIKKPTNRWVDLCTVLRPSESKIHSKSVFGFLIPVKFNFY